MYTVLTRQKEQSPKTLLTFFLMLFFFFLPLLPTGGVSFVHAYPTGVVEEADLNTAKENEAKARAALESATKAGTDTTALVTALETAIANVALKQKIYDNAINGKQDEGTAEATATEDESSNSPFKCDVFHLDATNCTGAFVYVLFIASGHIMAASGVFFDLMMSFGLNKNIMDQEFVKTAWEGIRDLANMLFIFVLIWMAIATVLNLSGHNAKATLVKLIIAALLINFSLFTSRVIIDAGNISALFFYDALAVGNTQNLTGTDAGNALNSNFLTEAGKGLPIKGVSTALMTTINPQEMITGTKPGLGDDMNKLIFIYVASIVLLLWMAWVFFTTSFLFLSRIAILWVLMAVSPIMFVGGIVPGGIKNYSKQLWGELIGKSFCITIFLFFVWLAVLFANPAGATLFVKDTSGLNFIEFIVVLALKFGIIIVILDMGKKQTKKQCDSVMGTSIDIGKKLMGVAGMAGGLAIGGAAGSVLRNVVGGGAMRNLESVGADGLTGRQRLASGGAGSRLQLRAMEGLERSSFDIRKSGMGKYGNMNKGIGGLGMGRGEGGFAGQVEQKQKYYTSLKKKLGDVTDKDPTKALAAQGASKRFEEQMDKESSAWLSKNIQTGSAYYKLLKHIAGGGKSSLSGSPMTEANAVKNLASFGQQITSEARNTVAKGFGSSTGVAKARAAQEVARENQKALKTAEQSAQLQKERDAQLKEYEDLKKKHSSLSRADATPTEWKGSAEKNIGTLEESIEKLTRTIKETEKDEQNLSTRVTAIMAQRSGQTDSTARNRMSTELKELEEQKETVSRTLSQTQDALREEKKGLEEMKTLVKLSENMNRFAQQDVADYKASQK